jgi:hypothetical protein
MFSTFVQHLGAALAGSGDPLQFPMHSLVGVIDDPSALPPLVAALGRSGVDGGQVRIIRESDSGLPGRLQRMRRRLQELGPEPALRGRYEAELHDGHAVVVVRDLPRRSEPSVRVALATFGVHFVHLYGRFTVTTLDA